MRGLVLEGGGAKGSYHVGAILALKKLNIKIDGVVGTSIGSINGAFVASGQIKELESLWHGASCKKLLGIDDDIINQIKNKKIDFKLVKSTFKEIISIIKQRGIKTDLIKNLLSEYLNEKKLKNSNIDFGLVTYNITNKKPIQIFKDEIPDNELIEYILASSYFPVFKFEKLIDNSYYFDGGIYNNCPIDMLLDKGYDEIIAVRTKAIGIFKKVKTDKKITYISTNDNLGSIINFNHEQIEKNIKLGYFDTLKEFKNLEGNEYYFEHFDDKYVSKIIKNRIESKTKLINIIEKILKEENKSKYKIYNIKWLIFKYSYLKRKKELINLKNV